MKARNHFTGRILLQNNTVKLSAALLSTSLFVNKQLVLCGDARIDSPGYSATKATYSFMEHDSNVVLHMEHGDKREVSGVHIILFLWHRK